MTIFQKIAYSLGLSSDSIEEELQSDDEQPKAIAASAAESKPNAANQPIMVDPDVRERIFMQVLAVFNASMPDFLGRSVDPKRQSQFLYEALDEGLRDYIASLESAVREKVDVEWQAERGKMQAEADSLKKKADELEERRSKLHERQLSAERQKRALSERVHDLEEQVLKLEAEKEQYEIETKCMANKTKAVGVLEEEIAELQRLLQEKTPAGAEQTVDSEQIEALKTDIAQKDSALAELQNSSETLKKQLEAEQTLSEEQKKDIEEKNAAIEQLQVEIALHKSEIDRQKSHADKLKEDIEAERARTAAAEQKAEEAVKAKEELEANGGMDEATMQELEEIKEHVSRFEEVKHKMDVRIDKLKESLKASQKEAESLRKTLSNNLKENMARQRELLEEIETLKSSVAASDSIEYQTKEPQPVAAEEVDDVVLGTDWLVATPAKEVSMRAELESSDFGYQDPPKKNKSSELDALPSLFD